MSAFFLLSFFLFLHKSQSQTDPNPSYPPHACHNFGLCKSNPTPTAEYLTCASGNCVCQNGTTGSLCAQQIDACSASPCPTTGEWDCNNTLSGPLCSCAAGYTGSDCAMLTSNPCANNPCLNGGTCNSPDNVTYTCTCTGGYLAPNCQFKNICTASLCNNGGTCTPLWNGQTFYCTCPPGWFDRNCNSYAYGWKNNTQQYQGCFQYSSVLEDSSKYLKITDNSMTYTMCQNLLETQDVIPAYTMFTVMQKNCYLSRANYLNTSAELTSSSCNSSCPGSGSQSCGYQDLGLSWGWKVLWTIDNQMYNLPQNCSTLPSSTCQNNTGHGMCISMSSSYSANNLGYMCLCKYPYTQQTTNYSLCITPTPCTPNPCQNGGTCNPLADLSGYTCSCPDGYDGEKCQYTLNCSPTNPCLYGSTCVDNPDGTFKCLCLDHYSGLYCQNINACEYADPCVNGTCVNNGTGIQVWPWCQCSTGYTGIDCDSMRNLCDELEPCQYNGTCQHGFMSYNCTCIPGTTGQNCSTIINNCVPYTDTSVTPPKTYPTRCNTKDNQAQCINAINSFSCNCSSQWTQDYCDLNVIIEQVMITIYGRMDPTMLPLLNNLLQTPAMISDMVPFIIGTLTPDERVNLSWSAGEMFDWATYEEKELDLGRDFVQWNDVVLGNCFTFNHLNATQLYTIRSSEQQGGLRVRLKVNQQEYEPWTDTAAILVFIHFREDYVMSESVRYNAEPNNEVVFFPYLNSYTRLGGQYGTCVDSTSEVKAFYFPGDYTTDGCLRSCYQDMVLQMCDCMDPRYPMAEGAPSCDVANMTCIDDASAEKGDPSTWPDCVCPLPCANTDYGVTWSKSSYRGLPIACVDPTYTTTNGSCVALQQDSVIVEVMLPEVTYSLFAETPAMDLNGLIGNLGALLGVLMGICAITFIEIGVMIFTVVTSILCKPEEDKPKKRKRSVDSISDKPPLPPSPPVPVQG